MIRATIQTLLTATLALTACAADPAPLSPRYTGVNIATGGFAPERIPGRYGYDYAYPTAAEAAPFKQAGMNTVRVPLMWERIQSAPGALLVREELDRLDAAIAALKGFELIILDVHNYGAYRSVRLGDPKLPAETLANLWAQLAKHYKDDKRIAFGLMNEPVEIDARVWRTIAEKALLAIRATGARNLVLIPGTNWTGAHSWMEGGSASNGAALADLRDPANNIAFEMHQYADFNSSGTNWTCVAPQAAAGSLLAATRWLRANKLRGFLGEFGTSTDPNCLAALDAMLRAMTDASDVWLGWTYWSAGAWWGPYPMNIQPDANGPKPQMAVLRRYLFDNHD